MTWDNLRNIKEAPWQCHMNLMKAAEIKETLHHLLPLWPAVKSHSVHIVRRIIQWPDLFRVHRSDPANTWRITFSVFGYLLPPSQTRCMRLQLRVDLSVLGKLPQTQTDSSSSVCCSVCVVSRHPFKLVKNMLVRAEWSQDRFVSWGRWDCAVLTLGALCAHGSSPPGHPRTLCSPTLGALHRFHATLLTFREEWPAALCSLPSSL